MIVYGGGSVAGSGLLERVKASLTAEGIATCELSGVQPNPIDTKVPATSTLTGALKNPGSA